MNSTALGWMTCSVFMFAIVPVLRRESVKGLNPRTSSLIQSIGAVGVAFLIFLFSHTPQTQTFKPMVFAIICGAASILGIYYMSSALQTATASECNMVGVLYIIGTYAIDLSTGGEKPTFLKFIGVIIMMTGLACFNAKYESTNYEETSPLLDFPENSRSQSKSPGFGQVA